MPAMRARLNKNDGILTECHVAIKNCFGGPSIYHIQLKKKKQDTTLQVLYKNTWTGKVFNIAIVVLSCQEDLMSDPFLFILS